MRQRLQHLREWSREPREEEEKLSEEELVLVHEIIKKVKPLSNFSNQKNCY